mmetsp:Transcript_16712/g.47555  ORF Transcript_16712/g.47555 Transcript_16712/m.47555 type:complete len:456 (-) Transcript_16712:159-1526(-)
MAGGGLNWRPPRLHSRQHIPGGAGRRLPVAAKFVWWLVAGALMPQGSEAYSRLITQQTRELWTFLAYDIGLGPSATISLDLHNDRPVNNTYVMVLTHSQWDAMLHRFDHLQGGPGIGLNSYLITYWRAGLYDHVKATFHISAPTKDRYHIGILNTQQQVLSLRGELSLVNPGGQQLSLQEQRVPDVLLWTSALYFASCMFFAVLLGIASHRGRTAMHLMIATVVLLKAVVLLLWWCDCMQVSRTGSDSSIGNVGWQLLDKVQTILELMMFFLIALGWKFLRGTLNETEIRFAVGISVISFYLGVFEVACTTPPACSGYQLSRYILHSLCYLVVIVAMNFNLQMIYAEITTATASVESGKLYRKKHAYKLFRWIFLAFIIAPTVELFLKVTVMPWDALWLFILIQQLRTWAIYMSVVVAFRPDPPSLSVFELTRDGGSDDEVNTADADGIPPGVTE